MIKSFLDVSNLKENEFEGALTELINSHFKNMNSKTRNAINSFIKLKVFGFEKSLDVTSKHSLSENNKSFNS